MKNINTLIKNKLKEKKMSIDTFISKSDMSKSTIYRVMKGYQKPSEELIEKIIKILNLNPLEQRELRYYGNLANTDEDILSARDEVLNLLYKSDTREPDKIELVYYDGEKYIHTFNKILNNLLSLSGKDEFSCSFRLINCCQDSILEPLYTTISQLMKTKKPYTIEHLVHFSTYNLKENIMILSEIIPLLALDNYSVRYCETDSTSGNSIFCDFLIIDYSYNDESNKLVKTHLYITFLREHLSACYVADSENIQDFFERSYKSLQYEYRLALNNQKKFEVLGVLFAELEMTYDTILFKPNPCYNRIPFSVYESMKGRNSEEAVRYFMNSYLCDNVTDFESQLNELLTYIKVRIKASFDKNQMDIFTRKGLESFASTGMLSDHLEAIPPFNAKEIKATLEYIMSRDADKKDTYNFYIMKNDEYSNEDLLITVFKKHGLIIEYNNPKYKANDAPYCFIEHQGISTAFSDFAENYVPIMLAMPQKEAHNFINSLIEKYCY